MSMSSMSGMSSMGMSGQTGAMTAYLHFTPLSDTLWFQYWVPTSPSAVLGACIGLFLLAIFERWVAASKAVVERAWSQSAQLDELVRRARQQQQQCSMCEKKPDPPNDSKSLLKPGSTSAPTQYRLKLLLALPPFVPSHNISRGILHGVQTMLMYLFMLASMTFQAAFIISMCLGAGVGEMMFGRYITAVSSD